MNKLPRVATIILNYNGPHLLTESIESMLAQTYKNHTVYVADGASTDNSVEFITNNFPHVKLLAFKENHGTAGTSNDAAMLIDAEYLNFVSNDMKFDKHCVLELVKTITSSKEIGLVTSVLVKHKPEPGTNTYLIDNAGIDVDVFGFIYPRLRDIEYKKIVKKEREVFASVGGCFIIRKELFSQVGGYDDSFWSLSDDIDLCWRIRLLGYKIMVNEKSYLYHHISATLSKHKMSYTRYLSERNILTMLLKNYELSSLLWILPIYFVLEFGEIIFFVIKLRLDIAFSIVRAIVDNVKRWPQTALKRNVCQSTRVISDKSIFKCLTKNSYKLKMLFGGIIFSNFR